MIGFLGPKQESQVFMDYFTLAPMESLAMPSPGPICLTLPMPYGIQIMVLGIS